MTIPKLILITTDNNEIEFQRTVKTKTELIHIFKFTKSKTKLNKEMELTESILSKLLNYSFKIIE